MMARSLLLDPTARRLPVGVAFVLSALLANGTAAGPAVPADPPAGPQPNPIECWSKTSSGAVRVGEVFSLVVTCAVSETDALKVVIDQAGLDPPALRVAPFEVLDGTTATDLPMDGRRFVQYAYRLRLIADDSFGKDVKVPEIVISYRLQRRAGDEGAIEGRDRQYILPSWSMRILSLVPADAPDIRDAGSATFGGVEDRSFRATALFVIAGVLFALAGLEAIASFARLVGGDRRKVLEALRWPTDRFVLRSVGRELDEVRRERQRTGWTPSLVGRALAGLRVVGAYAIERRVGVKEGAGSDGGNREGALLLPGGWLGRRRVVVSSPLTGRTVAQALAALRNDSSSPERIEQLEALERALERFTRARYGSTATLDDDVLDTSLVFGVGLQRRLRRELTGSMKRYRAAVRAVRGLGRGVWRR